MSQLYLSLGKKCKYYVDIPIKAKTSRPLARFLTSPLENVQVILKSTINSPAKLSINQGRLVLHIHFIYVYSFFCRSELRSRHSKKTLTYMNENRDRNRKLNDPKYKFDKVIYIAYNY